MGCYGIGVSRTVATIYEENVVNGKNGEPMGISLPISVAPYLLQIVAVDDKKEVAEKIYNKLMEAGVPVVPGTKEPVYDAATGEKLADEIGYPVMIKASSGGGGKGMRVSRSKEDFEFNFNTAQRESANAFGDDTMYIEKFIEQLGERFNIREIAFDRWGAVQMVQNLEGMGFTVVPSGRASRICPRPPRN